VMADFIRTGDEPAPQLPQNVEAEAALLGALMIDNRLVDQIADRLQPHHFFEPLHGRIYSAVLAQVGQAKVANPVSLKPFFEADESMKQVGGPAYLAQLTGSGAAVIGARDFATQIIDLAMLRALIGVGHGIVARAMDTSEDVAPAKQIEAAEAAVAAVTGEADDGVVEGTASQAMVLAIEPKHMDPGVTSGIEGLDRFLGPIKPTDLIIVAGRPGMGKSVLGQSYGLGVAKQRDENEQHVNGVLLISLEMGFEQLGERIAADLCFNGHSGINHEYIESKTLTNEQARVVARAASEFEAMPFQIVDVSSITSARLDSTVRRWKRRFAARGIALKLVVVDYLQLIRTDEREKDLYTRITEVSKALKATAKRHRVGIMAIAQLSRDVEKREDKRPVLADLRDSGQLEQDADGVVFLYRDEYYLRAKEPPESDEPKAAEERAKWESALAYCEGKIDFIVAKRRGKPAPRTGHGRWYGAFQAIR
jgi:replicative DNA helicase